ncbi:MAG: hypothetical protein RLN60_02060 [Phycisphaerales bacterium]
MRFQDSCGYDATTNGIPKAVFTQWTDRLGRSAAISDGAFDHQIEVECYAAWEISSLAPSGERIVIPIELCSPQHFQEPVDGLRAMSLLENVKHAFQPGFADNAFGGLAVSHREGTVRPQLFNGRP